MSWKLKPEILFRHWMQNSALVKERGGIILTERRHNLGQKAVAPLELHYGICLQSRKIKKNVSVAYISFFTEECILGIS